MDEIERDDKYLLRADVPGFRPDEVKIEVEDDVLTVYRSQRWSSRARSVPLRSGRILAARVADSSLHVVTGGGHLFLLDEPESSAGRSADFWTPRDAPPLPGGCGRYTTRVPNVVLPRG